MSLHKYTTTLGDTEIVVTMGWDCPFQGFFMTIIKASSEPPLAGEDDEEGEDVFLFDNLEQKVSHPQEINGYLLELAHRGIDIPPQMINEVLADGIHDVGNKIVEHVFVNGTYVRKQS